MNSQLDISIHQTISLHVSKVIDKTLPYPINCTSMLASKDVLTTTGPWLLNSPLRSFVHLFPIRSSFFSYFIIFLFPHHFPSSFPISPLRCSIPLSGHPFPALIIICSLRSSFILFVHHSSSPFNLSPLRPSFGLFVHHFHSSSAVIMFPPARQSSCFIILLRFFSSSIISPLRTQGGRCSGEISPKQPHRGESLLSWFQAHTS